jgi:hypothetical protein
MIFWAVAVALRRLDAPMVEQIRELLDLIFFEHIKVLRVDVLLDYPDTDRLLPSQDIANPVAHGTFLVLIQGCSQMLLVSLICITPRLANVAGQAVLAQQ